jgi:hypothetical protein
MLGFFHIAWVLSLMTKGGGKKNFVWGKEQQRPFDDLKHRLCSTPVISFLDLQQPFKIETDASDYAIGAILTQHDHLKNTIVRHSEILSGNTPPMIRKCIPLYKHVVNGNITFLERRRSSTLITSLYSLYC